MRQKALSITLQIVILAACFFYLSIGINWPDLGRTFALYSWFKIIGVLALTIPIYALMGIRLQQLTHGGVSTPTGIRGSLLALGINNILPARLGEVAKAIYFKQKTVLGFSQSMGIIFLERFLDINILAVTGLITAMVFGLGLYGLPLTAAVLICWGLLVIMIRRMPAEGVELTFIPSDKLRYFIKKSSIAIGHTLKGNTILKPFLSTVFIWAFSFLYLTLIPLWLMDLHLTAAQILAIYAAVYLGLTIPGLPGGIGMTEGAIVAILSWNNIPKTEALAIALTIRAFNFLPPTLLGLSVFMTSGMSLQSLKPQTEDPF
nr:lysylphosphatidylglycerol synthase transmembrane domain-containing protein [uncultured Pseudodesulfovibrio sp.]